MPTVKNYLKKHQEQKEKLQQISVCHAPTQQSPHYTAHLERVVLSVATSTSTTSASDYQSRYDNARVNNACINQPESPIRILIQRSKDYWRCTQPGGTEAPLSLRHSIHRDQWEWRCRASFVADAGLLVATTCCLPTRSVLSQRSKEYPAVNCLEFSAFISCFLSCSVRSGWSS